MWLDLRTGYRCNHRCRFCDQAGRVGEASLDALVAVLRAQRAEGVWLAGGEITLRPDLPRLVSAAREAGYARVGLQTNGRILAAPGAAASLRAAGLTDAVVAVHGPTAGMHDFLTQAAGSFRQALVGIRRLREAGVATRVSTVVTRSSTDVLPEIAGLAVKIGAEGHRWNVCRPQGADDRMLVPRFSLLQRPLLDALDVARDARIEADTAGVPLCFLPGHLASAADRLDGPPPARAFPPGLEEAPPPRRRGPPCVDCRLAHACAGPTEAYVERWGWDEIVPVGALPTPKVGDRIFFPVIAPCALSCPGCHTRAAFGSSWAQETTRALRQRLVRATGEPARALVFAGASPWSHPALPTMVREAARLTYPTIEVWGPLHPLATLDTAIGEKLAGLTGVRVPRLVDGVAGAGTEALEAEGARRLREAVPGCVLTYVDELGEEGTLFRADGPAAVWAGCGSARRR